MTCLNCSKYCKWDLHRKSIICKKILFSISVFWLSPKVFILSSLWEEIGFVIVEAAACNVNIISSNCKNGPKEFLEDGRGGYLFENNNSEDFLKKFEEFMNEDETIKLKKKVLTKIATKKFTFLYHFNSFTKILSN